MKLAVVRVRGSVRTPKKIARALEHLNLRKKHSCTIIEDTPSNKGQLNKIQRFVTWGPVNEETLKIIEKHKHNKTYRLNPPRKGFGRKGIKLPFKLGGALGDRGEKINDLLKRMA